MKKTLNHLFFYLILLCFYDFIYLFSSQNPRNIESKIEKENHHMIDYIKLQKHREEW